MESMVDFVLFSFFFGFLGGGEILGVDANVVDDIIAKRSFRSWGRVGGGEDDDEEEEEEEEVVVVVEEEKEEEEEGRGGAVKSADDSWGMRRGGKALRELCEKRKRMGSLEGVLRGGGGMRCAHDD